MPFGGKAPGLTTFDSRYTRRGGAYTTPSLSLNTVYQNTGSRPIEVRASADIALDAGEYGYVTFLVGSNPPTTAVERSRARATGIGTTVTAPANVGGRVEPGEYYKIETTNIDGTPTFTLLITSEKQL